MARIRSVHPGLFTDEAWIGRSFEARWLGLGLLVEASDQGVFEWKPITLKVRIFPADNVDVLALLEELQGADIITSFEHGGRKYGAIRNFRRFQRPKKPNSPYPTPGHIRTYVALDAPGSEPVGNQPRTGGEKSPQMEDGGGVNAIQEGSSPLDSDTTTSVGASAPRLRAVGA